MDIYEEAVLEYLTHESKVFVCPQFRLAEFGAVPDIVSLNFETSPAQVEIIEVSAAIRPAVLVRRLKWYRENENQMELLKQHLSNVTGLGSIRDSPPVIRVFIKSDNFAYLKRRVSDYQDIRMNSLETVFEALLDFQKRKPLE